ncbi:MAG: hypothetical protein BAJALOKI1v1_1330010 [Promethearchaeota archaeon]|nr:MAG: hypothetical protein BAJALOKI1v1_1330010 [Candidatus Lokiarchaeota archaeon]
MYEDVKISAKNGIAHIKFVFEEDESVIRGFLGLAEYFHTVIIKEKDRFFIPHGNMLFMLESA